MFLLMSAAYVGQDLKAEFGKIPPCMLPLGNKRLYEHQFSAVTEGGKYISLPQSYEIEHADNQWFLQNNVSVIKILDGATVGESLNCILDVVKIDNEPLCILFGDTLVKPYPRENNVIHVAEKIDGYNWDSFYSQEHVITGFFSFSDIKLLKKCLLKKKLNFIQAANLYGQSIKLKEVSDGNWYDFGHVNRYYQSKASFTTERAFNELVITKDWVEKKSANNIKIEAEANWFSSLPSKMRIFTPQFIGYQKDEESGNVSYKLEYLYNSALNELYVFGKLDDFIWRKIIDKCLSFIGQCKEIQGCGGNTSLVDMLSIKTNSRISQFLSEYEYSLDKVWTFNDEISVSVRKMIEDVNKIIESDSVDYQTSLVHGDFCFSNILYDFRTDRIKTIDPRGLDFANQISVLGDIRYDIAKLAHSIIGLYDWIISKRFELNISPLDGVISFYIDRNNSTSQIQKYFLSSISHKFGVSERLVIAMQIHLFLSMLPLHFDDKNRQFALLSNAFRLYKKMLEKNK